MGEGETPYAANPANPPPTQTVIPAPSVIPAKAGIHTPKPHGYPRKAAARPHRHSGAGRNPEPRLPLAGRWGVIAASVHPELVAGRTDAGRLGWLGFRWGCLPARRSSCDKLRTNGYHAGLLCRCHPSAHCQPRRRPIVIPAKAGIHSLKARLHPLKGRRPPPPSFRRRPESGTPTSTGRAMGRHSSIRSP